MISEEYLVRCDKTSYDSYQQAKLFFDFEIRCIRNEDNTLTIQIPGRAPVRTAASYLMFSETDNVGYSVDLRMNVDIWVRTESQYIARINTDLNSGYTPITYVNSSSGADENYIEQPHWTLSKNFSNIKADEDIILDINIGLYQEGEYGHGTLPTFDGITIDRTLTIPPLDLPQTSIIRVYRNGQFVDGTVKVRKNGAFIEGTIPSSLT